MNATEIAQMPKLGFGLMRLPETDGAIDIETVKGMVDASLAAGFNYFDTAYVYHSGTSENAVKQVLVERYPREAFMLATKLPAWAMESAEDRDRIFNEQLERTGAGYFDFYLLHSVENGKNYDTYERFDCFDWALEKKAAGLIRHFGFSFHGTPELLEEVLDRHPEVEFVQIQLNYADWENPLVQSERLYKILHERQIPIIVMEPVKGGKLADIDPELAAMLDAARPGASPASWALRYVGSLDGVMTILSGMSTPQQMAENIETFSLFEALTADERAVLADVVKKMLDMPQVACTACRYCTDGCPQHINIPEVFRALNIARRYPKDSSPKSLYQSIVDAGSGRASDCIACGQCESVCPQHLPIIELLQEAADRFDS